MYISDVDLSIMHSLPAIVLITDRKMNRVKWCNLAMENETGYSIGQIRIMADKFFEILISREDYRIFNDFRGRALLQSERKSVMIRVKCKDDYYFRWVIITTSLFQPSGAMALTDLISCIVVVDSISYSSSQIHELFREVENSVNYNKLTALSQREKKVLSLLSTGKKLTLIAKELFISYNTLNTHIKNIKRKLNIDNTSGLIVYGKQTGF